MGWIIEIVLGGVKALLAGILSGWFKKTPEQTELQEAADAKAIQDSVERDPIGSAGDWLHKHGKQ